MDEVTGAQLIAESLKTQVKKKNPLKTHIAKIYKAKKKVCQSSRATQSSLTFNTT